MNDYPTIQDAVFKEASSELSKRYPKTLSISYTTELCKKDLSDLKERGLFIWDYGMKSQPWMTPISNKEHPIHMVMYYGESKEGYNCVGYALGCVNVEGDAIEINFMEKQCEADVDLDRKFLPTVIDVTMAYRLFLNQFLDHKIDKFVLVGPIEGVKRYYTEIGFEYVADYDGKGADAMVRFFQQ